MVNKNKFSRSKQTYRRGQPVSGMEFSYEPLDQRPSPLKYRPNKEIKPNGRAVQLSINFSEWISELFVGMLLFFVVVFSSIADVALGTLSMGLLFKYDIPYGQGRYFSRGIIGFAASLFTSGVQVILIILFKVGNKDARLTRGQQAIIWSISLIDTYFDMLTTAWLTHGQTAFTFTWDKPFTWWLLAFIIGAMVFFAENIAIAVPDFARAFVAWKQSGRQPAYV